MKKERFAALLMAASVLACGCSVQATGEVNIPQTEAVPDTQEKVTEDIAPMETETEEATEVVAEPVVQTVTVTAVADRVNRAAHRAKLLSSPVGTFVRLEISAFSV